MLRRIAAGLLAMVLMLSVLPANAFAAAALDYTEEFNKYEVYEEGKKYPEGTLVWVEGLGNKANPEDIIVEDEDAVYEWVAQRNPDLSQIRLPKCLKIEHVTCFDLEEKGCVLDESGKCMLEPHRCPTSDKRTNAYYLFRAENTTTGSGSGGGTDTDDVIPGSASFTVYNIDEYGNPVQGSEFYLLAPPREGAVTMEVKENPRTDANGKCTFNNIVLDDGVDEATWQLTQQGFKNNPVLQNKYAPYTDKWNVTIARAEDDTFYIKSVTLVPKPGTDSEDTDVAGEEDGSAEQGTVETGGEEDSGEPMALTDTEIEEEENPVYTSGYDSATNTLTIVNTRLLSKIVLNMEFVGIDTNKLPDNEEFGIDVVITRDGDSNFKKTVEFPIKENKGKSRWQWIEENLVTDTYHIEILTDYGKVPGYEQGDTISMLSWPQPPQQEGEDQTEPPKPEVTTEVTTGYNRTNPIFTIYNHYTANGEPPTAEDPEISNTILVKTLFGDEALPGAAYGLYRSADAAADLYVELFTDTDNDGEIIIQGLEKEEYIGSTFVLKQYSAPEGYQIAKDCYYVKVSTNADGEVEVRAGETPEQSGGENIDIDYAGNQVITIKNTQTLPSPEKTTVTLTCKVNVTMKAKREDSAYIKLLEEGPYAFYVEWDGGKSGVLDLSHNETGVFELDISADTPYKVVVEGEENPFVTVISNRSGSVTNRLTGNSTLTATNSFTIVSGNDDLDLHMIKVNSRTKKPLADAKFTLKDENGKELGSYTTKKNGEIDIVGRLNSLGEYRLQETKAPDDYTRLRTDIVINVENGYTQSEENGKPVLKQGLEAHVSHSNVEKQADGTYYIKNTHVDDNPQTGDAFNIVLWTGVLVMSMAALTIAATTAARKKRRVR